MKKALLLVSVVLMLALTGAVASAAPKDKPDNGAKAAQVAQGKDSREKDSKEDKGKEAKESKADKEKKDKANRAHVAGVLQSVQLNEDRKSGTFEVFDPKTGITGVSFSKDTEISGKKGIAKADLAGLAGSRVNVAGNWMVDASNNRFIDATGIHVIPGRAGYWHAVGEVTGKTSDRIDVKNRWGQTLVFAIGEGTKVVLPDGDAEVSVGDVVTVVAEKLEPANSTTAPMPKARSIVVHGADEGRGDSADKSDEDED